MSTPAAKSASTNVVNRSRPPWASVQQYSRAEASRTDRSAWVRMTAFSDARTPVNESRADCENVRVDVVIIGGGIVGLTTALESARAGMAVTVVDPTPTHGASFAAAGMIAPLTEYHIGDDRLVPLLVEAARVWPGYAASLAEATGLPSGYVDHGTVVVGHDADDKAELLRHLPAQRALGFEPELLTTRAVREREPALGPTISVGIAAPADHAVHNREFLAALMRANEHAGVTFIHETAQVSERDHTVELESQELRAEHIVIAAGIDTVGQRVVEPAIRAALRPVKGQILRLQADRRTSAVPELTVRALVRGKSVYIVPRPSGEIVIGATVEERQFDLGATAAGVFELLRDARAIMPSVDEWAFTESWAGMRPTTQDHLPIVGASSRADVHFATGHGRNGILLGPLTGLSMAHFLATGAMAEPMAAASPARFLEVH